MSTRREIDNTTNVNTACATALALRRRGIFPVPIHRGQKAPTLAGWQNLRLSAEDIHNVFAADVNGGFLTGEPSGGLVDIDLDSREAVVIGRRWLPTTGMVFGRRSKRSSHWVYRISEELRRETFVDPEPPAGETAMLLEVRGTGHQTMAPGSLHPSGELVEWESFDDPAEIALNEMLSACGRVAAAALLARHWQEGQRHDSTLPLAGFLLRHGLTMEEAVDFLDAMAEATDANREKVAADVRDTATRLRGGEAVTGWPTLRQYFTGRVLETAFNWLSIAERAVVRPSGDGVDWPDVGELPSINDPVLTLASELIPEPIHDWVCDVSDRMSVPLEYIALPAMSALASVVGRTVAIRPMALDDWTVVPTLWGALVGGPGTLKSPAIASATSPLTRLAASASEAFRLERTVVEVSKTARESRVKVIKKKIEDAARKGKLNEFAALKRELQNLLAEPEEAGCEHRYLTNDATTEKLAELLIENPRGFLLRRDELIGWLDSFSKQGREADRAFYLEAWNGTGCFYVDRIQRGSLFVPALTLSVFGGIQPDRLNSFFAGAMAKGGEMDGLLQRFQLIAWPDSLGEFVLVDRRPDEAAAERAFGVFRKLDMLEPSEVHSQVSGAGELPFLRFDAAAQELFYSWYKAVMRRTRSMDAQSTLGFTAHLSKFPSLLPKLALIFHLVEAVDGGARGPVGLAAASMAEAWTQFLESHARKVYTAELKGNVTAAHALAEKIRAGAVTDGVTVRDIARREWSGLKNSGQVYEALDVLGRANWTRVEAQETGGRDRTVIRVNPKLNGTGQ